MYQPSAKRRHTGTGQQVTYRGRPEVPDGAAPGEAVLGHTDVGLIDTADDEDDEAHGHANRIAEHLFLGSREAAERPVVELRALGISAVVNCTRDGAVDGVPCVHAEDGVSILVVYSRDFSRRNAEFAPWYPHFQ